MSTRMIRLNATMINASNTAFVEMGNTSYQAQPAWNTYGVPVYADGPRKKRPVLSEERAFKAVKRIARQETATIVDERITNAYRLLEKAKANGQIGLSEELGRLIAVAADEKKIANAGFGIYINSGDVNRFVARTSGKVNVTPIENYGRPIPDEPAIKLNVARKAGMFDRFIVMHAGVAMIKTMAERIRQKDPIVFGLKNSIPDRYYFICDWIDEHCNMTLSQLLVHESFAGSLQSSDGDISESDLGRIERESHELNALLQSATPKNWKDNESRAKEISRATDGPVFRSIFSKK